MDNQLDPYLQARIKKLKAEKSLVIFFEHYKGKRYCFVDIAKHSETLEPLVIYQALYGDCETWARPASMFFDDVIVNDKAVPRFRRIDEET